MLSPKFTIPVLCLASALTASAAGTASFNAASGTWESAANWTTFSDTPSFPPASADAVRFAFSGGSAVTLAGDYSAAGLAVSSTTTLTGSTSLRTLTITAGSGATGLTTAGLTLDQVKLSLTGGTLLFNAGLVVQNGGAFEIASTTASLRTSAANGISSGGGVGNTFNIAAAGTAAVTGGNATYTVGSGVDFSSSGTMNLQQGTFHTQSTSGSLAGTVSYAAAGSATFRNSGTMALGALTVGGTALNGGTDAFENTGTMNLGAGGAVSFNAPTTGTYTISNAGGTMNINGGNTVTLAQPFAQTGASTLNLNSPTLVLNSAMSITGGTVIGSLASANSSGSGDATFATGTGLSPGASGAGNVGTIAFPQGLTLQSGSTLTIDVNSNVSADRVQAGGVAAIAGSSLVVRRNATITDGTVFTILSGSSVTGTFLGLAEGATVGSSFVINYGTVTVNAVTLTAVPEPGFYACTFGLGLAGFAVWRSNRRRA